MQCKASPTELALLCGCAAKIKCKARTDGGRVVEVTGLENRQTRKRFEGSNPAGHEMDAVPCCCSIQTNWR